MSDQLRARALAFLERFRVLHQRWRNGAIYRGKPDADCRVAEELCELWPDDSHLEAMAEYFLRLDDPNDEFLMTGTRSVSKFGARASACDEAIRDRNQNGKSPLFVHLWRALPRDGRVWLEATSCTVRDNQVTITGSLSKLAPYREVLEQAARAFNPHFAVTLLEAS